MQRQSNEEKLIAELLDEEANLRGITLALGLRESRRKRIRRRAGRAALILAPIICAVIFLVHDREKNRAALPVQTSKPAGAPAAASTAKVEGTSIRFLTDRELLDLFKDRPVALVGRPGH